MRKLLNKKIQLSRTLACFGLAFILIATINNIVLGTDDFPFTKSLLFPATRYITPVTNGASAFFTFIFILFPEKTWIMLAILVVESIHLVLTGFQTIGILLFTETILILFSFGFFKRHFKRKAMFICIYWFFTLATLIPSYGFFEFLFAVGMTIFIMAAHVLVYRMLADRLSFLIESKVSFPGCKPEIDLPPKGSVLDLENRGLSERQIECVYCIMNTTFNYKQIADEIISSESTVKKDMQELYKKFGVKNREMLRLLLLQYNIKYNDRLTNFIKKISEKIKEKLPTNTIETLT